jgi:hypothetical protein
VAKLPRHGDNFVHQFRIFRTTEQTQAGLLGCRDRWLVRDQEFAHQFIDSDTPGQSFLSIALFNA